MFSWRASRYAVCDFQLTSGFSASSSSRAISELPTDILLAALIKKKKNERKKEGEKEQNEEKREEEKKEK